MMGLKNFSLFSLNDVLNSVELSVTIIAKDKNVSFSKDQTIPHPIIKIKAINYLTAGSEPASIHETYII